ncbi:MAG: Kelch repeat-containing protein [Acidimicrobiia bacterium]
MASGCGGCGADVTGALMVLEDGPAATRRAAPSPRVGRLGLVAGVAVAVFLVGGALAGPRTEQTVLERPARPVVRTQPPDAIPAGWEWKPTGPLPGRHGHAAVWTGSEMVLWGGERPGRAPQGAAYDPRHDTWRRIARSPLENRSGPAAAWSGAEVLIWGGINGGGPLDDGAAYDPATDRWRLLAPSPLTGRVPLASAWTGREMVVMGARGYGRTVGATDTAAYDPATDTWRPMGQVPITINEGTGAWTGRELVVYGGLLDRSRRPQTPGDQALGAALDTATGLWRTLPPAPLSSQAVALAWDGQRVVAWDWDLVAAALDPATDRWSNLPGLPLERRDCLPAGVAAGNLVFAQHCGQAAVLERGRPRWRVFPAPRGAWGAPIFTGDELVLWLGPSGRPHDGTWLHRLA